MRHSNVTDIPGPQVLYPFTIGKFFRYLIAQHAISRPAKVIVCMSFESFRDKFLSELPQNDPLLMPTLQLLSDSEYIEVVFVPTLPVLLAMLSTYDGQQPTNHDQTQGMPAISTLALLFPLQLHRDTASDSAQGMSRTFASAVSASICVQEQLIIAEPVSTTADFSGIRAEAGEAQSQQDAEFGSQGSQEVVYEQLDPWDRQVPILNVTSSRFRAGERGWMGRTVAARTVAQQWCTFKKVDD